MVGDDSAMGVVSIYCMYYAEDIVWMGWFYGIADVGGREDFGVVG
jgi:hypothetical protein